MAKSPTAPYEAGRRGAGWLKVKPVHTLDLVVLAVEWGSGRRTGKLSNIHLGARDPATGGFVMLGKTFKGMTDAMLDWQTARFTELADGPTDGYVVKVRPEQVVEIAFDGVQSVVPLSGRHGAAVRPGAALPRRQEPRRGRHHRHRARVLRARAEQESRPVFGNPLRPGTVDRIIQARELRRDRGRTQWLHPPPRRPERIEEHDGDITYIRTDKDLPPVAIIDRSPITTRHKIIFGDHRRARRGRVGGHRVLPRRDGQRGLVRHRRDLHLRHRVPVLRPADRDEDRSPARRQRHARRAFRERHRLHADRPAGAVRTPLRGDRRRRAAGRPGAGDADGLSAGHHLDHHRRGVRRLRAGLPGVVDLHPAARPLPRADGPRRTRRRSAASPRSSACSSSW